MQFLSLCFKNYEQTLSLRPTAESALWCIFRGYLDPLSGVSRHWRCLNWTRRSICNLRQSNGLSNGFATVSWKELPWKESSVRENAWTSIPMCLRIIFYMHSQFVFLKLQLITRSDRQTIGRSFVAITPGSRTDYYSAIAAVSSFYFLFSTRFEHCQRCNVFWRWIKHAHPSIITYSTIQSLFLF